MKKKIKYFIVMTIVILSFPCKSIIFAQPNVEINIAVQVDNKFYKFMNEDTLKIQNYIYQLFSNISVKYFETNSINTHLNVSEIQIENIELYENYSYNDIENYYVERQKIYNGNITFLVTQNDDKSGFWPNSPAIWDQPPYNRKRTFGAFLSLNYYDINNDEKLIVYAICRNLIGGGREWLSYGSIDTAWSSLHIKFGNTKVYSDNLDSINYGIMNLPFDYDDVAYQIRKRIDIPIINTNKINSSLYLFYPKVEKDLVYRIGDSINIKWDYYSSNSSVDDPAEIEINLIDNGNNKITSLANYLNEYSWEIDTNIYYSNEYRIEIGGNKVNGLYDTTLIPFTILGYSRLNYKEKYCSSDSLSWQMCEDALQYKIQISNDSLFYDIVIDKNVLNTEFPLMSLEQGKNYYWRVSPIYDDGIDDLFYDTYKFYINKYPSFEKLNYDSLNSKFSWSLNGDYSECTWYIYNDNYKDSSDVDTNEISYKLDSVGTYYWYLLSKDFCGNEFYSDTLSFDVTYSNVMSLEEINIGIYPNPVNELLNSNIDCYDCKITIFDIFGQTLSVNKSFPISTKDLSSGVYFIKIEKQDNIIYRKCIIK